MERNSKNTAFSKKEFLELIEELKTTFQENEWCFRASEENVRAELIDPILKAIGWKMPYLRREDHGKDYLLCSEKFANKESVKIIVEAKKYREQLLSQISNTDEKNKSQLARYCKTANTHVLGILTNGRRWIKFEFQQTYSDLNFVSEIDLLKDDDNALYDFFCSISFNKVKDGFSNTMEIRPCIYNEYRPTHIVIDGQPFNEQGEANYYVAERFLEHCIKHNLNPYGFSFTNKIVSEEPPKNSYGGERTHKEYKNKINGKKCYLIGDYGIYVKITLLKEINSVIDLEMEIKSTIKNI